MERKQGLDLVKQLGNIALQVHEQCGAPIVIVLCMSAKKGGSILSGIVGVKNATELAAALRRAADYTNYETAEHQHLVGPRPAKS